MREQDVDFVLTLKHLLPHLHEAVKYFIGDSKAAIKAARALSRRGVKDTFHVTAELYLRRLIAILDAPRYSGRHANKSSLQAQESADRFLSLIDQLVHEALGSNCTPRWSTVHSELAYRKIFRHPRRVVRRAIESDLESCCSILAADQISEGTRNGLLPVWQTVPEWNLAKDFCKDLETVHEALAELDPCQCAIEHGIKLSFALPCSPSRGQPAICIYFRQSDHVSYLAVIEKVHRLNDPREAKAVDVDAACSDLDTASNAASVDPRNLCQIFASGEESVRITTAFVELQLRLQIHTEPACQSSSWNITSPQAVLAEVPLLRRLQVAAVIAYAYLGLSGSFSWSDQAVETAIFFRLSTHAPRLHPFLVASLKDWRDAREVRQYAEALIHCGQRPSLPALGKTLLELVIGRELSWKDVKGAKDEAMVPLAALGLSPEMYLCVVDTCLMPPEELKVAGRFSTKPREIFLHQVVKALQYVLQVKHIKTMDDIFRADNAPRPECPRPRKAPGVEASSMSSTPVAKAGGRDHPGRTERSSNDFQRWTRHLQDHIRPLYPEDFSQHLVRNKVAIIDTGANLSGDNITLTSGGIRGYWSWCEDPGSAVGRAMSHDPTDPTLFDDEGYQLREAYDNDGHGSKLLSILMKAAPECEIYIAKVFDTRNDMEGPMPSQLMTERIAAALRHAADVWEVDVISMSFGFPQEIPVIEKVIDDLCRRVILIAAASNDGANGYTKWPASHDSVICMHAAYWSGEAYGRNAATRGRNHSNLSIMGCNIEAGDSCVSGTSCATVVAAGMASCVIDLFRLHRNRYIASRKNAEEKIVRCMGRLKRTTGMEAAFLGMAVPHNGNFNNIAPWAKMRPNDGVEEFLESIIDNV